MSSASISPVAARAKSKLSLRRLAAWLYARAVDPEAGLWLVIGFAVAHAVLWTLVLVNLRVDGKAHKGRVKMPINHTAPSVIRIGGISGEPHQYVFFVKFC